MLLLTQVKMAARRKEKQINLLPKDNFSESSIGRVVLWFLSTFRIMVIIVELIVVAAFLSRFWLDSKNADLSDEIKQKQAQIKASEATEKEFRELQKRLTAFSVLSSQPQVSSTISLISNQIPPNISLSSISFSPDGTTIGGVASNEQDLAQFLVNLKSSDKLEKVTLNQFGPNKDNPTTISFTIAFKIKQEKNLNTK